MRLCAEHRVPLIPFGAGTSLEGHILATRRGSVSLDLSEMNALLDLSAEDMDCSVQAGITRLALNSELRHTGLRFPVDPGADASLGGMAACGASGTSAVRCGTMRENTLGLTAVLASGEVITTGGRARKSSAGYDLTRLLIGSCARMTWSSNPRPAAALERQTRRETGQAWLHATCDPPVLPHPGPVPPSIPPCVWHREGTLGVITELTLRLQAVPPAAAAAVCTFPSLSAAASAVALVLQVMIPHPRHDPCGGMAPSLAATRAVVWPLPSPRPVDRVFGHMARLLTVVCPLLAVVRACCAAVRGARVAL